MFTTAEKKIVCKIESFIHVPKCLSAKLAEELERLVHESETSFNSE